MSEKSGRSGRSGSGRLVILRNEMSAKGGTRWCGTSGSGESGMSARLVILRNETELGILMTVILSGCDLMAWNSGAQN